MGILHKRWTAGVLAVTLAFVQLIIPVQSAFATSPNDKAKPAETVKTEEPKKVYVCKYVGTPGENERLQTGQNPIEVSVNATGGTAVGSYFSDAQGRSFVLGTVPMSPEPTVLNCPNVVNVNVTITQIPVCGPNNDAVVPMPQNGVTFTSSTWTNNQLTVTATLDAGKTWSDSTVAPKTFNFVDAATICEQKIPLPQASSTDPCGPENASWGTQQPSAQYTWSESAGVLSVTAAPGFYFEVNGQKVYSHNYGQAPESNENCPTVPPCVESKGTTIVSKDTQFADYQDTRSKGHYEFLNKGLRIYTDDTSSESKVAWYKNVDYPLSELGTPAMDYQSVEGIEPGMQLVIDFDGDGSVDGILVGESVYGNDWWLTGSAKQFVKNGAPNNGGGSGSQWYGTLDEWYASFQDAQVKAVGFSLGSGVKADGVLKSLTFGCYTWKFKKEKQDTFTPEIYKRDQFGNIVTSARFTVEVCQKAHKWEVELRTSLDKLNCQTFTNVDFGTDGQWFKNNVDVKKNKPTKVTITESYIPPACTSTGPWTFTWDYDRSSDESDVSRGGYGYGEDKKGSWSNGSNVWTLLNNCIQGQGGAGGSTPPTTPAPVVATSGQGAAGELPDELPITGTGSPLSTWFALLAAILTYGAVYFLQSKKRVEQ